MTKPFRPARTETYEHTISGLLTKRREMISEAEGLRDRLAAIKNDMAALDRTLAALGFSGDLEGMMPPHSALEVTFCDLKMRQRRRSANHLPSLSTSSAHRRDGTAFVARYAAIIPAVMSVG